MKDGDKPDDAHGKGKEEGAGQQKCVLCIGDGHALSRQRIVFQKENKVRQGGKKGADHKKDIGNGANRLDTLRESFAADGGGAFKALAEVIKPLEKMGKSGKQENNLHHGKG